MLALSLLCVLPLMGIQPVNLKAQLQAKIPPQLKTVLTKKYIHKLPLTEQQQAYLKRVDRKTIIAGLAALGITAIAVAGGILVSKKPQTTTVPAQQAPEPTQTAKGITDAMLLEVIQQNKTDDLPRIAKIIFDDPSQLDSVTESGASDAMQAAFGKDFGLQNFAAAVFQFTINKQSSPENAKRELQQSMQGFSN